MKKILILGDITAYKYHDLRELLPLTDILKKDYEIHLKDNYGTLTKEELTTYDAVINYIDNWEEKGSRQAEAALITYTEEGGKLLVLHCGLITKSAPGLLKLWGGSFRGHAAYQNLSYKKTPFPHPVTRDLAPFTMEEEPYLYALTSPEDTHILCTYSMEGKDYPAGWTREQEKGHILYLAFGHNSTTFQNPAVLRLCINSLKWLVELQ